MVSLVHSGKRNKTWHCSSVFSVEHLPEKEGVPSSTLGGATKINGRYARSHRPAVRISASHAEDRGSIPLETIKITEVI